MRKVLRSLFFIMCISSFFSCTSNAKDKILRTYHDKLDSFIYVDENELTDLHKNSQDFILFLYSDCGCGGQSSIAINAFKDYISTTKTLIYAIGEKDYLKMPISLNKDFPIYPSELKEQTKVIPSLYFYKDGSLEHKVKYSKSLTTFDGIKKIIDKYTYANGKYCINDIESFTHEGEDFYKFNLETTLLLDQLIGTDACVNFTWKKCGDCLSFKTYERKLYKEFTKKLYYFEVNHFIESSNRDELWYDEVNGFPYRYQFDSYKGGKVPAFVHYVNGVKESMIIYHNDVLKDNIIIESFFEDLIGKSMTQDEINDYEGNKVIDYLNEKVTNE